MTAPLRVALGEDSYLMREGLRRLLDEDARVHVVCAEADLDSLREAIDHHAPDVVITDIRMPPTGTDEGIRLATELRRTQPSIGVVVLSEHAQISYALTLFADGAVGRAYLLKDRVADRDYLIEAAIAVSRGRPMLDSQIVGLIVGAEQEHGSHLGDLTGAERQVLALVADGKSNSAIAQELVLTRRAVERRINAIFSKLALEESETVNRRVLAAMLYTRAAP